MTIFFKTALLFLITFVNINAQVVIPDKESDIMSLNGSWKFKYISSVNIGADSGFFDPLFNYEVWDNIKVPGHWELQGFAEPNYKKVDEGTGLYVTSFTYPQKWTEKQMFIVFDGVQYGYDFWINGRYVGTGASSYNMQMFDISEFVKPGIRNALAVKVTTRNKGYEFDLNDCWGLSGIYRDVRIISVPQTHIKDFFVKTYVNDNNAKIDLSVILEKEKKSEKLNEISLSGKLFSPDGKLIKEFSSADKELLLKSDTAAVSNIIEVENPLLWTAESPYLYNLQLTLSSKEKEIQKINRKIGIRQITIEDGVLKINGQNINLRGVNWHNLDPIVGRALTEEMILKDLDLMRKANMNFIRTSHYPPHPRAIELCDSIGFYVMCEVPFGYGDKHLTDSSYLEILLNRAEATLWRDKNHPSVIIWSVGNENPLTDICIEAGKYVKKTDNTRPICFPQVGSYFGKNHEEFADKLEILSPHYIGASKIEEYDKMYDKPIIVTEYAHALGLDLDKTETVVDAINRNPGVAGAAVWHFFDQGILRASDTAVDKYSLTYSVWLDSINYYDNFGDKGADGLVYANRVPQVDYWEIRKVYSRVQALDDSITVKPGIQYINIRFVNNYDFKDLSETKCIWNITADNKTIKAGNISMKASPHDTVTITVATELPQTLSAEYYLLNLKFFDKENYQFNEKTYRLWNDNSGIENKDLASKVEKEFVVKDQKDILLLETGKAIFSINKNQGSFKIENSETKKLILDGPFARTGRKETLSSIITDVSQAEYNLHYWKSYILKDPVTSYEKISVNAVKCNYKYERADSTGQFIEGYIIYKFSDSGWVDVNYSFKPVNATGIFLDAGISFQVSSDLSEMRWIGNGPYPSYPGKSKLSDFGFYHLNSEDLNYQGNRSNVDLMILSDKNGDGFVINSKNANISVERNKEGLIVSHNALVSGRYNKKQFPETLYKANKAEKIEGSFSILPINNDYTPQILKDIFGELNKTAKPFKPFYHSYDQ